MCHAREMMARDGAKSPACTGWRGISTGNLGSRKNILEFHFQQSYYVLMVKVKENAFNRKQSHFI